MTDVILKAENLTKEFTLNGNCETVLNGISIEIYDGDFTVIMGPSGAGKSSLLYALSGMDRITGGKVTYCGDCNIELGSAGEKTLAALRRKDFGFVFQQPHLVENLTVFENVAVAGYLDKNRSESETRNMVKTLLSDMNIHKSSDKLPSQISGGEAQRAAVARAVINRPRILFADEPTGALNRKNTVEVLDIMSALNKDGQSIVMVTHDISSALRGNRIIYLDDGLVTGELRLPPYTGESEKERDKKLSEWLLALEW